MWWIVLRPCFFCTYLPFPCCLVCLLLSSFCCYIPSYQWKFSSLSKHWPFLATYLVGRQVSSEGMWMSWMKRHKKGNMCYILESFELLASVFWVLHRYVVGWGRRSTCTRAIWCCISRPSWFWFTEYPSHQEPPHSSSMHFWQDAI